MCVCVCVCVLARCVCVCSKTMLEHASFPGGRQPDIAYPFHAYRMHFLTLLKPFYKTEQDL